MLYPTELRAHATLSTSYIPIVLVEIQSSVPGVFSWRYL